jgi:ribonuclease E
MTFHEAGLQVLEQAGKPMHFEEITTRAIQEGLLSHVGRIPEQTMRERLLTLARRTRNRKVLVVGPGQFALSDWGLQEDPAALAELENPTDPELEGPPRRGKERHPAVSPPRGGSRDRSRPPERPEASEAAGRRKKRYPPLSEVALQMLSEAGEPQTLAEIIARAREKSLVSGELSEEMLGRALREENRIRTESRRRPHFAIDEGGRVELLERGAPEPATESDRGPRIREPSVRGAGGKALPTRFQGLVMASKRSAARALRRRLADLDAHGLERVALALLEASGYRDVRTVHPAQGGGAWLTTRRRLGLTDVRFLVRLVLSGEAAGRDDLLEFRREMLRQNAHAGMWLGPAELGREVRTEVQVVGQPLVMLLCGDAMAEELVMRQIGVVAYEQHSVDEDFWRPLKRQPGAHPPRDRGALEAPHEPESIPAASEGEGEEGPEPGEVAVSPDQPATATGPEAAGETPAGPINPEDVDATRVPDVPPATGMEDPGRGEL